MANAIWNGVISFGLLNIPVAVRSGERSTDLHFRMLDSRDNNPVRFERVNAETGEEVPWKEIVKAFEYEKGNYVVLQQEDFKAAAPASLETVEIQSFVDREDINPMHYEKPYYLVPAKKAEKGYVLLREVLRRTNRIALGRVVIRTREYLCGVMPLKDALVMLLLRFPQEIVSPDEFSLPAGDLAQYRISDKELGMAEQLVESMTVEFDPTAYVDDFRVRLQEVIDTRIRAQQGTVTKAQPESDDVPDTSSNVVDFMALLKQSLDGKGRSEGKGGTKREDASKGEGERAVSGSKARDKAAGKAASQKADGKNMAGGIDAGKGRPGEQPTVPESEKEPEVAPPKTASAGVAESGSSRTAVAPRQARTLRKAGKAPGSKRAA